MPTPAPQPIRAGRRNRGSWLPLPPARYAGLPAARPVVGRGTAPLSLVASRVVLVPMPARLRRAPALLVAKGPGPTGPVATRLIAMRPPGARFAKLAPALMVAKGPGSPGVWAGRMVTWRVPPGHRAQLVAAVAVARGPRSMGPFAGRLVFMRPPGPRIAWIAARPVVAKGPGSPGAWAGRMVLVSLPIRYVAPPPPGNNQGQIVDLARASSTSSGAIRIVVGY